MEENIRILIEQVEQELNQFKEESTLKIEEFMRTTGLREYMNATNTRIAYLQGKLEGLQELLKDLEKKVEVLDK